MADLAKLRVPRIRFRRNFPPLREHYAMALGRVAATWSTLEGFCAMIIGSMLAVEGEARAAVVSEIPMHARLDMIGAMMFAARDQELFDHWRDICNLINALRTRRNDLIHGEWDHVGGDVSLRREKARGRVAVEIKWITIEEMEKVEAEIVEMIDQLSWFYNQLIPRKFGRMLPNPHRNPSFDPIRSSSALAQDQVRQAKQAQKQASRGHPSNRPKSSPSRS